MENRKEKLDEEINNRLKEVRETVDADRIWVMEFRQMEEGTPSSVDMIYENVAQGVSEEIGKYDEVNFLQIKNLIEDLIENKVISYESINEVDNGEVLKMFELEGNASMYFFAIKSINAVLIGILGVDYVMEKSKLSDQEKVYMRSEASILAGYMESREIQIEEKSNEPS